MAARIPQAPTAWVRDGVDGAGKTTFADELAAVLRAAGRTVLRASVDGFHGPQAHRHRRGRHAWEGFWLECRRSSTTSPRAARASARRSWWTTRMSLGRC